MVIDSIFSVNLKHMYMLVGLLVPVWKACRASSAAPIYFTSYGDYVDGGVMANNPCEYAMSEITQFYHDQREKAPEFSIAVSVGTGYDPRMGVGDTNTFCKGLLDFKKIYEGVKQLVDLFGKAVSASYRGLVEIECILV